MNSIFSRSSLMILESLSFTETLYAFDFDGTLSKIVRNPSDAVIGKTTEVLLKKLSSLVPLAIVSGRSISDLKSKLSFEPQYMIGNHGMEGLNKNGDNLLKAKKICSNWREVFSKLNFEYGLEIEDKSYSFALHYRRSRNKKNSKLKIQSIVDSLSPAPQVITGKSVINLLPPGAPHKGMAILDLMNRAKVKHVFYIGDDDTDEDVFSLPNSNILSVRVGEKRSSHARFFIKRQSEINKLLKLLIRYNGADENFTKRNAKNV